MSFCAHRVYENSKVVEGVRRILEPIEVLLPDGQCAIEPGRGSPLPLFWSVPIPKDVMLERGDILRVQQYYPSGLCSEPILVKVRGVKK